MKATIGAIVTMLSIVLSVFVAVPCLFFGYLGMCGALADVSVAENVRFGTQFLLVAVGILTFSFGWMIWQIRRRIRSE